jgi:hypothetical protein
MQGVLYRRHRIFGEERLQLVLPENLKEDIFKAFLILATKVEIGLHLLLKKGFIGLAWTFISLVC